MTALGTVVIVLFLGLFVLGSIAKSVAGTAMKYPGLTIRGGIQAGKFFKK